VAAGRRLEADPIALAEKIGHRAVDAERVVTADR
jgi:hypothetical protein